MRAKYWRNSVAKTHYKRPLPDTAIAFASEEGRQLFASMATAKIRERGLSIDELACLARCNGAEVTVERADAANLGAWRAALRTAAGGVAIIVASYDRGALGQTGSGALFANRWLPFSARSGAGSRRCTIQVPSSLGLSRTPLEGDAARWPRDRASARVDCVAPEFLLERAWARRRLQPLRHRMTCVFDGVAESSPGLHALRRYTYSWCTETLSPKHKSCALPPQTVRSGRY
jgi:hypothetical protein